MRIGDKYKLVSVKKEMLSGYVGEIWEVKEHNGKLTLYNGPQRWTDSYDPFENGVFEKVEAAPEEMAKEKAELAARIVELDEKIRFCALSGSKKYNEKEHKIYKALQIMQNSGDVIQAAREIAKLC